MITVKDIIELGEFVNIRFAAPCNGGLERRVREVCVLDSHPLGGLYEDLVPGDFVLTSLGWAHDDWDAAEMGLLLAMDQSVAAIAVHSDGPQYASPAILAKIEETGVPLFFYDGGYYERIIVSAEELFRQDREQDKRTRLIGQILGRGSLAQDESPRGLFRELIGRECAAVQCVACSPVVSDGCALNALRENLEGALSHWARAKAPYGFAGTLACCYEGNVLGFLAFGPDEAVLPDEDELCLREHVANQGHLHAGLGRYVSVGEGRLGIRQALGALEAAKRMGRPLVRWDELGVEAFRIAASEDSLYTQTSHAVQQKLFEYEKRHGMELEKTAHAFSHCHGVISETASQLHQHENTVRYRLKKVKEILGLDQATDRELAEYLSLVYLPLRS